MSKSIEVWHPRIKIHDDLLTFSLFEDLMTFVDFAIDPAVFIRWCVYWFQIVSGYGFKNFPHNVLPSLTHARNLISVLYFLFLFKKHIQIDGRGKNVHIVKYVFVMTQETILQSMYRALQDTLYILNSSCFYLNVLSL